MRKDLADAVRQIAKALTKAPALASLRGNYIGRLQKSIPERSRGMSVRRVVVASMVLAIILTTMGTGWANSGFDKRSLRGTWGFSASGRVLGQQATAVGLITADGKGVCTTSIRFNITGILRVHLRRKRRR